jgi:hypothetical protein
MLVSADWARQVALWRTASGITAKPFRTSRWLGEFPPLTSDMVALYYDSRRQRVWAADERGSPIWRREAVMNVDRRILFGPEEILLGGRGHSTIWTTHPDRWS